MPRISLPFLILACLMPMLAAQQAVTKVDVNLASQTELLKLPGITVVLARKIVAERPYFKPADLHRAGLSDSMIQNIRSLIIFTRIQYEKPGPQGGEISGIDVRRLYPCSSGSTGELPKQVDLAGNEGTAAICLPRGWFASDGETLTVEGQAGFSDLRSVLNDSGKHVKIVGLHPFGADAEERAWTRSVGKLVAGTLSTRADDKSVELFSATARPRQSASSNSVKLIPADVSKTAQEANTLVLVLPAKND